MGKQTQEELSKSVDPEHGEESSVEATESFIARVEERLHELDHRVTGVESAAAPAESMAGTVRADLSERENRERSKAYRDLRNAESAADAEDARAAIREIDGPNAEIGDHVLILANGRQVRTEYAGATHHDGVPVTGAYESVQ